MAWRDLISSRLELWANPGAPGLRLLELHGALTDLNLLQLS